jgi:uncharacterized protein with GYD domain
LRRWKEVKGMIFIVLARWRKKPTKEMVREATRLIEQTTKEGAKILGMYWTFGRYDSVTIVEGPNEKAAMKALLRFGDLVSTETLVALTAEEAAKLVE